MIEDETTFLLRSQQQGTENSTGIKKVQGPAKVYVLTGSKTLVVYTHFSTGKVLWCHFLLHLDDCFNDPVSTLRHCSCPKVFLLQYVLAFICLTSALQYISLFVFILCWGKNSSIFNVFAKQPYYFLAGTLRVDTPVVPWDTLYLDTVWRQPHVAKPDTVRIQRGDKQYKLKEEKNLTLKKFYNNNKHIL